MQPFCAHPLEEHQTRYAAAVSRVWFVDDIATGGSPRPGELPDHVFDWTDGLRLIISKDADSRVDPAQIHMSASAFPQSELWHAIDRGELDRFGFLLMATHRFNLICKETVELKFIGFTERGIPHWASVQIFPPSSSN